jgi:hypothetical protein
MYTLDELNEMNNVELQTLVKKEYGVKTFPGIREGIEERKWDEVSLFIGEVAAALNRVADEVDRATSLLL